MKKGYLLKNMKGLFDHKNMGSLYDEYVDRIMQAYAVARYLSSEGGIFHRITHHRSDEFLDMYNKFKKFLGSDFSTKNAKVNVEDLHKSAENYYKYLVRKYDFGIQEYLCDSAFLGVVFDESSPKTTDENRMEEGTFQKSIIIGIGKGNLGGKIPERRHFQELHLASVVLNFTEGIKNVEEVESKNEANSVRLYGTLKNGVTSDIAKNVVRDYTKSSAEYNDYLRRGVTSREIFKKNYTAPAKERHDIDILYGMTGSSSSGLSEEDMEKGLLDYLVSSYETKSQRLDKLLENSKIPCDCTVYKGIRGTALNVIEPLQREISTDVVDVTGRSFTDPSYMSTSLDGEIAKNITKDVPYVLEINVPKGAKGLHIKNFAYKMFEDQDEVLFARNRKMTVRGVEKMENGCIKLKVDMEK